MPQRHRGPLPLPPEELVRLQGSLNPYHSTLWEGQGLKVFVARVPSDDPDLVNDLERIVECAAPRDVEQADGALVLAARNIHTVPMDPLRHLMQDRVAFDARHAARLRQEVTTTAGVRLFRATDDPKRRLRLAILMAKERVADMDDDDLLDAVEDLGDELATGLRDVHCVYLIARTDHVRLRTQEILPELLQQWDDPARRERLAQERLEESMRAEAERQAAKKELDDELRSRFSTRVAVAPVRTVAEPLLEQEASVHARTGVDLTDVHRRVDAMESRLANATAAVSGIKTARGLQVDAVADLAERMQTLGYAVRLRPRVAGVHIDLAAERARYPQRVVAFEMDHLDRAGAKQVLTALERIPVDEAIVIASDSDRTARGMLRTKARVIAPIAAKDLAL